MCKSRAKVGNWPTITVVVLVAIAVSGCSADNRQGRQFVTMGTAPVGGAFRPVGEAIASVLNEHKGDNAWRVQPKGTKGSQQNIRELEKGYIQLAMSNAAISYRAVEGQEGFKDKKFQIRTVVTLAPNIGLFITRKESGIETLADLANKRVAVGPAGAGFEMFLGPLLTDHGVTYTPQRQDFTPVNDTYSNAVALLGDGNIDAAFMGGAVPTQAVTRACRTYPVRFIPYDEARRRLLIEQYPFYREAVIPAKNRDGKPTYPGMSEDFPALNVGSMHLITSARADESFIYDVTKTIWNHRAEIASQHKAGNAINEKNAARFTGTPFHPGAIRFYEEIGIWSEPGGGNVSAGGSDPTPTSQETQDEAPTEESPA